MTLSAVIPVFNRAGFLTEAVRSVLMQPEVVDVVVVDDGSTDETPAVASRLAAAEERLRVVTLSHCGMPGRVRNAGVATVDTTHVAFLDSDDLWLPGKAAAQLALHRANQEVRISHTRERWIRNGAVVSQRKQRHRRAGDLFTDALVKCILGPSTVVVERKLFLSVGGFREDLEVAEDYELWLRICDVEPVGYVDEPYTVKRAGHGDQLSERYGHIERFRIEGLRDLVDRGRLVHAEEARAELARKCRIYARGAAHRGRHDDAARFESLAARYDR